MKSNSFLPDAAGIMLALTLVAPVLATEYSRPIETFPGLPLEYPAKPFVLRFTEEELAAQPVWAGRLDGIIISKDAPSPIRIGCRAVQESWRQLHPGAAVPIIELAPDQGSLPPALTGNFLIAGMPEGFALAESLIKREKLTVSDEALNGDGFIIKPVRLQGINALFVTSVVPRGVLYGLYELEERTTVRGIPLIDQSFVPAIRYRNWGVHNFVDEPLDVSGRLRLNLSVVMNEYWPATLFFKSFPEMGGNENSARILENQARLHRKFKNAVEYGAIPTVCWNPLSFSLAPRGFAQGREALGRLHPGMLAVPEPKVKVAGDHGRNRYNLCPSDPATRQFVESAVKEFVTEFKEVEMLLMYFSDIGGELICGCDRCASTKYIDRVVDYANLVMKSAREVNPRMRFMIRSHALTFFLPLHHPELADDPTKGFAEIKRRLGPDVEAVTMRVTSPPGGDFQSWLSPECSMLGQGVPLYFFNHYYEAGGPGIVAPISPIMSHLSWQFPICMEKLRKFVAPGQGMVGGDVVMAGQEVSYWYPDMDPQVYMQNWCRAKYGDEAGRRVAQALVDTHRLTEMFYLKPNCSESCTLYRWGAHRTPWAVDMQPLVKAGLVAREEELRNNALNDFMYPLTGQPQALREVNGRTMDAWLDKFAVTVERQIARRSKALLDQALKLRPHDGELQRLSAIAAATEHLVNLFHSHHTAMIYANAANNTAPGKVRDEWIGRATVYLQQAAETVLDYKSICWPIMVNESRSRLKDNIRVLYINTLVAAVREACHLFDQDFPGHSALGYFDGKLLREVDAAARSRAGENLRRNQYTSRPYEQAVRWQKETRRELFRLMQLSDLVEGPAIPLDAKTIYEKDLGAYTMKELEISSTATRRIRVAVTIPKSIPKSCPAVVAIGGHSSDLYSVFEQTSPLPRPALLWDDAYHGFATELTKRGYVTISTSVSRHNVYEQDKGRILMGERLWDLMRCVDYLTTMPEVDPDRIGCGGLSLGGEMAMYLGAMDERIAATVSAGTLTYMDNLAFRVNACQCFNFPGLRELVEWPDIFALVAPRPLQCQNGIFDRPWFTAEVARTAMEEVRKTYVDLECPENAVLDIHEGGHIIDLPELLHFFEKHLQRSKPPKRSVPAALEPAA